MWCFALVNNRLEEIFFDKTPKGKTKILGYYYINRRDYKTKKEQKWIKEDTARVRLTYRKGKYYDKIKELNL